MRRREFHVAAAMIAAAMILIGAVLPATGQTRPVELAPFYVAPNGNDYWSGHYPAPNAAGTDGPFATLQRARDVARQARLPRRSPRTTPF